MFWISLSFARPFGFRRDKGPPPVIAAGWLRVSWWRGQLPALVEKMGETITTLRAELRL